MSVYLLVVVYEHIIYVEKERGEKRVGGWLAGWVSFVRSLVFHIFILFFYDAQKMKWRSILFIIKNDISCLCFCLDRESILLIITTSAKQTQTQREREISWSILIVPSAVRV